MTSPDRIDVASADGTRIAAHDYGSPYAGAPVVVAIHGYPDNHEVWDAVAGQLAPDARVIAYDVRGCGGSAIPATRDAYRIERLVEDLTAVIDEVSPDAPVHLLGHDWGSVQGWAGVAAPALTGRVTSYVSISGPALEHISAWLWNLREHPLASARQIADSWYTLGFQVPKIPEIAVRLGILGKLAARASGRAHNPVRPMGDQINGLELYRANLGSAMRRATPTVIDVPVHVLAPKSDPFITARLQTEAPRPWVPNLQTTVVDGGHWIVVDRPDVVASAVREQLAAAATR